MIQHRGAFISVLLIIALLFGGCSQRLPSTDPEGIPSPDSAASQDWQVRISTGQSGLYRVSLEDLKKAGVELAASGLGQTHLYHRGIEQPVWLDGEGGQAGIIFYAQANDSLYAAQDVYLWMASPLAQDVISSSVTITTGFTAPAASLDIQIPGGAYLDDRTFEQNQIYQPQVDQGDHWFWASLTAANTQEFGIELDDVHPGGTALIQIGVWSNTEAQVAPDHHLKLNVNGKPAIDETWDGRGRQLLQAQVDASILKNGGNTFSIEIPGDLGVDVEINQLDWMRVVYPRLARARANYLEFVHPGGELKLEDFSTPIRVYEVGESLQAGGVPAVQVTEGTFSGEAGRRYLAVGKDGFLKPLDVSASHLQPDLRAAGSGADYVVVGPTDLLEPLQPLLDLRASQGMKTASLPVQAIYDQFNYGLPEPQAVNAWLRYAARSWTPAPRYLLLVGDASYDPKGYVAPAEANRLPTFLVSTVFGGQTASDVGFVQLNDDPWPDLATGRVPAQNAAQVKIFVEKTLAFEQALTAEPAGRKIVAIADGQDPIFAADAQAFLDLFPGEYPSELFAPQAGIADANQQISSLIAQGDYLLAYFGHGSVNMWGKDRLFTTQDIKDLPRQTRLPVVLNLTCLTGLYTHPKVESLTEAFLWQPEAGAAAVMAPSSLTLPTDQSFLTRPFIEQMVADPALRLGDLHLAARREVPVDSATSLDVMLTFMLFGDPALRMSPGNN